MSHLLFVTHPEVVIDPDQPIPLNWVISAPVARYVWNNEFLHAGNSDELQRLLTAIAPAAAVASAPAASETNATASSSSP